jgi:hypothetical protein
MSKLKNLKMMRIEKKQLLEMEYSQPLPRSACPPLDAFADLFFNSRAF